MEIPNEESRTQVRFGDRSTSDVVVRIRTQDNRDDWIYCHSHTLVAKSEYFADRLSDNWPTCQILDSRNCVDVHCEEKDFDHHITVLRLLYSTSDVAPGELCSVKNALGMLKVAVELRCPQIISSCVGYLEASPWEEAEEEEILNVIPKMGSETETVLARLRPVDPAAVVKIFLSAIRFATSSSPPSMNDLKVSAQEQLEYMLTEDEDIPLLIADDEVKSAAKECVNKLLARFVDLVDSFIGNLENSVSDAERLNTFQIYLSDLAWAFQILTKLESARDFIATWVEISLNLVSIAEQAWRYNPSTGIKLKVLEVASKALEAIGYGNVVLPAGKRLHMAKLWLPFTRTVKRDVDSAPYDENDEVILKPDGEFWQSLESAFVSMVLTLPSSDQAEILHEWLESEHIRYPDLTEVFEVWCYRSKVSRRRLALLDGKENNVLPRKCDG